jgi:hypothetical protein
VAEAHPGRRHDVGVDVVEQLGRIDVLHAQVELAAQLGADALRILGQEQHALRGVERDHARAVRPGADQVPGGHHQARGFSINMAIPWPPPMQAEATP